MPGLHVCPECNTRVWPMQDGTCPACRRRTFPESQDTVAAPSRESRDTTVPNVARLEAATPDASGETIAVPVLLETHRDGIRAGLMKMVSDGLELYEVRSFYRASNAWMAYVGFGLVVFFFTTALTAWTGGVEKPGTPAAAANAARVGIVSVLVAELLLACALQIWKDVARSRALRWLRGIFGRSPDAPGFVEAVSNPPFRLYLPVVMNWSQLKQAVVHHARDRLSAPTGSGERLFVQAPWELDERILARLPDPAPDPALVPLTRAQIVLLYLSVVLPFLGVLVAALVLARKRTNRVHGAIALALSTIVSLLHLYQLYGILAD